MPQASEFLSSQQPRARWMRLDTAQLLKRFFFCERSLLVSEAAWIPFLSCDADVKPFAIVQTIAKRPFHPTRAVLFARR